jgi:tripartite-type tricarboxylate transporter receptor subunit TctC
MPDVPTIGEVLPGYDRPPSWNGFLGPAGMPAPVLAKLNAEAARAVATPEMMQIFATIGAEGVAQTPAQFTAYIRSELDKWGKAVKASGAKVD